MTVPLSIILCQLVFDDNFQYELHYIKAAEMKDDKYTGQTSASIIFHIHTFYDNI